MTRKQNLAFRLSKNVYLLMGKGKPIKNKELAEKAGVSIGTVSKIKNGWQGDFNVDIETVERLADALGVDAVELLKEA